MLPLLAFAILAIAQFDSSAAGRKAATEPLSKLVITGERLSANAEGTTADGNVRINYLGDKFQAKHVTYHRESRTLTLVGNVKFEDDWEITSCEKLIYRLDTGAIRIEGASLTVYKKQSGRKP